MLLEKSKKREIMKTIIDAFVVMTFAVFGVYGLSQGGQKLFNQIKTDSLKKAGSDLVNMSSISNKLTHRN